MNKGTKKTFFLCLAVSLLYFSCATTKPKLEPIISENVWENKTKSESFAQCLEAVRGAGYNVLSESEKDGTIQTDWRTFRKEKKMRRFKLDIQILESAGNMVTVTTQTKYQEGEIVKSPRPDELWQALPIGGTAWRDIPEDPDLEKFLKILHLRFESLLGPTKREI